MHLSCVMAVIFYASHAIYNGNITAAWFSSSACISYIRHLCLLVSCPSCGTALVESDNIDGCIMIDMVSIIIQPSILSLTQPVQSQDSWDLGYFSPSISVRASMRTVYWDWTEAELTQCWVDSTTCSEKRNLAVYFPVTVAVFQWLAHQFQGRIGVLYDRAALGSYIGVERFTGASVYRDFSVHGTIRDS